MANSVTIEQVELTRYVQSTFKVKTSKKTAAQIDTSGKLEINSFNDISDKMCRGIAKKAFMAANRAGKDETASLADVAQALSDLGKMTDEIQAILDGLLVSAPEADVTAVKEGESVKGESIDESALQTEVKEFEIKDLNVIEDKMARGTAKKAFLAAKRTDADKVEAIRKALSDADKLDGNTEELLNSFSGNIAEVAKSSDMGKPAKPVEDISNETSPKPETDVDLPLFEITELNAIDDRMTRGMSKKIFTAGKRAEKSRMKVIMDIREGLESAGKLDDSTAAILTSLESRN